MERWMLFQRHLRRSAQSLPTRISESGDTYKKPRYHHYFRSRSPSSQRDGRWMMIIVVWHRFPFRFSHRRMLSIMGCGVWDVRRFGGSTLGNSSPLPWLQNWLLPGAVHLMLFMSWRRGNGRRRDFWNMSSIAMACVYSRIELGKFTCKI